MGKEVLFVKRIVFFMFFGYKIKVLWDKCFLFFIGNVESEFF